MSPFSFTKIRRPHIFAMPVEANVNAGNCFMVMVQSPRFPGELSPCSGLGYVTRAIS